MIDRVPMRWLSKAISAAAFVVLCYTMLPQNHHLRWDMTTAAFAVVVMASLQLAELLITGEYRTTLGRLILTRADNPDRFWFRVAIWAIIVSGFAFFAGLGVAGVRFSV